MCEVHEVIVGRKRERESKSDLWFLLEPQKKNYLAAHISCVCVCVKDALAIAIATAQ